MLKVNRKFSYIDQKSPYRVFLNDMELGVIDNGDTKDYNLKPGEYNIKVTGSGFHSPEVKVSLSEGQVVQLVCYPAYKDTKFSRFIFKNLFGNEAIYLKIDKDFYL